MSRFKVENLGGTYWLTGFMDEHADFSGISFKSPPVRLNFAGLTAINSVGVARFTNFTDAWGKAEVQFLECPMIWLDAMIMLPALAGPEENTARILSMACAYFCKSCNRKQEHRVSAQEVSLAGHDVKFPARTCHHCGAPANSDSAMQEFVALFEAGALGR